MRGMIKGHPQQLTETARKIEVGRNINLRFFFSERFCTAWPRYKVKYNCDLFRIRFDFLFVIYQYVSLSCSIDKQLNRKAEKVQQNKWLQTKHTNVLCFFISFTFSGARICFYIYCRWLQHFRLATRNLTDLTFMTTNITFYLNGLGLIQTENWSWGQDIVPMKSLWQEVRCGYL